MGQLYATEKGFFYSGRRNNVMSEQLTLFNYDTLDSETRITLKQRADRINERTRRMAQDAWENGREFYEAQQELAQHGYGCFVAWAESETGYKKSSVYRMIDVYQRIDFPNLGKTEIAASALYLLAAPSTPEPARQEAIARAQNGETITHSTAKEIVSEYKQPITGPSLPPPPQLLKEAYHNPAYDNDRPWDNPAIGLPYPNPITKSESPKEPSSPNYITLNQWNEGQRLDFEPATTSMNKTNDNIEWAAFSWNPVTGCLHNCAYCYARDIANRFYEYGFEPAYLPERLSQPANTKNIEPRWDGDFGYKNIFTCSMADLFGKWVPDEWIKSVLEVIANNPKWTFLLLSKFPIRMAEFEYPPNVWLGTSVDYQWAVSRAEKAFTKIKASGFEGVCWLSCEPMMERLTFDSLTMFDWVVMGGSSKSTQTPEYVPPFDDIAHLYNQARQSNCKVYFKTNLIPGMGDGQRVREYPNG